LSCEAGFSTLIEHRRFKILETDFKWFDG
jgi:hypothetical protein